MHVCEEFREKITEFIIDRRNIAGDDETQSELNTCGACTEFYSESRSLIDAMSSAQFDISEEQWGAIENRMHDSLVAVATAMPVVENVVLFPPSRWNRSSYGAGLAGLAAMLLLTATLFRLPAPTAGSNRPLQQATAETVVQSDVSLDPVTVQFLEHSELLLRDVMKLEPADTEDLNDARKTASEQLTAIQQRREAAVNVLPVVSMMDKYETILRDIRNLQMQPAAEDISDIQNRIEKNGLIANMKAFEPRVVLTDYEQGNR
jgi:hypothetical protein